MASSVSRCGLAPERVCSVWAGGRWRGRGKTLRRSRPPAPITRGSSGFGSVALPTCFTWEWISTPRSRPWLLPSPWRWHCCCATVHVRLRTSRQTPSSGCKLPLRFSVCWFWASVAAGRFIGQRRCVTAGGKRSIGPQLGAPSSRMSCCRPGGFRPGGEHRSRERQGVGRPRLCDDTLLAR